MNSNGTYFFPTHIAGNGRSVDWASIGFNETENDAYPLGGSSTLSGNGVEVILNQNNCISDVIFSSNRIYFKASGNKGNAKVTLTNNGVRVWTWHIWCTNTPDTYSVHGYTVMDRNLGAISSGSNGEDSIEESTGFYYPYGSPIGFTLNEYSYGYENTDWPAPVMKDCFLHPERPNLKNYQGLYVMFNAKYAQIGSTYYDADVWARIWGNGGNKTMYDPCPPGYKVTPYAFWNGISISAGPGWGMGYYGVYSGSCFFHFNGRAYAGTYTNYQGHTRRGIKNEGIYLSNAGATYNEFTYFGRVYMWTSSSTGSNGYYYHVRKGNTAGDQIADGGLNSDILTYGMGVRCVVGW